MSESMLSSTDDAEVLGTCVDSTSSCSVKDAMLVRGTSSRPAGYSDGASPFRSADTCAGATRSSAPPHALKLSIVVKWLVSAVTGSESLSRFQLSVIDDKRSSSASVYEGRDGIVRLKCDRNDGYHLTSPVSRRATSRRYGVRMPSSHQPFAARELLLVQP